MGAVGSHNGLDIFNLLLVNHKPRRQLDPELGVADPVVLTRLEMDAFTCQIKHINPSRQRGDGKTGRGGCKTPCVVGGESARNVEDDLRSQNGDLGSRPTRREVGTAGMVGGK